MYLSKFKCFRLRQFEMISLSIHVGKSSAHFSVIYLYPSRQSSILECDFLLRKTILTITHAVYEHCATNLLFCKVLCGRVFLVLDKAFLVLLSPVRKVYNMMFLVSGTQFILIFYDQITAAKKELVCLCNLS